MKRYWVVAATLAAAMLAAYLAATAAGLSIEQPERLMSAPGALAALSGVALLSVDVVAPVPSSLVMIANGALFGALLGSALSSIGSLGGFAIAFALGRRGGPLLSRLVGRDELARADEMLQRHGMVAIALSRPVPILAETTAMLAGASRLSWAKALVGATTGILPQALVYGIAGSLAASFADGSLVFIAVLAATALMWLVMGRPASALRSQNSPSRRELS